MALPWEHRPGTPGQVPVLPYQRTHGQTSTDRGDHFSLPRRTHGRKIMPWLPLAVAARVAWYDFCRIHRSIGMAPAVEAKIRAHIWELGELINV